MRYGAMSGVLRRREVAQRGLLVAAAVAAVVAVLVPPAVTAAWLAGPETDGDVVVGIWAWKGLLLLHAIVLAVAGVWEWAADRSDTAMVEPRMETARLSGEIPALVVILLLAAVLRVVRLDAGLWFDEILTLVNYVRLPVGRILTTFDSQNQHPLFSLLAHGPVVWWGEHAWTLRLPAALFGVAGVWAVYWLGRHLAPALEALLAAAFLACSYHHVWFSQNARGYTGLLVWAVVATALFLRMLEGERPRGWALPLGYAAAIALGAYTHSTGVFVAIGHAAVWAVVAWRSGRGVSAGMRWRPALAIVLSGTLTLLLYAPVLPQFLHTLVAPSLATAETDWQNPVWLLLETLRGLSSGVPGGILGVAAGAAVLAVGFASYARQRLDIALSFVIPSLLLAIVLVSLRHNLWPRFFLFAAGFAALILMRGVTVTARWLVPRHGGTVGAVMAVALVLGSLLTVPRAWGPKQDFEGAAAFIERARARGDAVVTVDITDFPFQRYLVTGWRSVATLEDLVEIERRHERTWVLYTFPTRLSAILPDLWSRLQEDYSEAAVFHGSVRGGAIVIKVRE